MAVLTGARLVLPSAVTPGRIEVAGDRLARVVPDDPGVPGTTQGDGETFDLGDAYVLPGFVDMHCHGGGGAAFTTGDEAEARTVAAFHLAHGTTTMLASLVTAPVETLVKHAAALGGLAAEGVVAGVHFEGPFLSAARCGAQDPAHLRAPDPDAFARMVDAAGGHARMMTIAPELPGATDLVARAVAAGVVAAVGHTDATYDETRAAIDAGASVATHLFNGMRPVHHREPGPVLSCLAAPEVTCELINDGVHLAGATVAYVAASSRAALVTDAMGAAGMGDGTYQLGSMRITVAGDTATLTGTDTIAGSTLTMETAVRRAVRDVGLDWPAVSVAASLAPARALGLADELGSLEEGKRADLVVLDPDDLTVRAVMRAGVWVTAP